LQISDETKDELIETLKESGMWAATQQLREREGNTVCREGKV
jgi:hypothetical protein